jgi:hypothetical protein
MNEKKQLSQKYTAEISVGRTVFMYKLTRLETILTTIVDIAPLFADILTSNCVLNLHQNFGPGHQENAPKSINFTSG